MKKQNWAKLFAHSVDEAAAVAAISPHQKNLDALEGYAHRVRVDDVDYSVDALKLLYLTAIENVLSPAVIDLLCSLEYGVGDELVDEVFIDVAIRQRKKTEFVAAIRREKRLRRERERLNSERESPREMSQYAVEDALSELNLNVRLNEVTKRIEVTGSDEVFELYSRANILAVLPSLLLDNLRSKRVKGLGQGTAMIERYLFNIADMNRYNPIHEMFEAHKNDDSGSLDLICAVLGIEDELDRSLVRKWFIQTVAMAFNTAEKQTSAEGVLVLQGRQGCGKTSFFRRMAVRPEWFNEGAVIDVRNKDSMIGAVSSWICELGEIDCTLKREQSALKAFITRPIDRIRFPYAAAESELPRSTSFCGTVNPEQFLNDSTGSRRYWVVPVKNIDKKFLFSMDSDLIADIWGYFYSQWLDEPEGFRLTDEEREQLERRNRAFTSELKYEQEILDLLDFDLPIEQWSTTTPAKLAAFLPMVSAMQIGKTLTKLSEEDERVKKTRQRHFQSYFVPLKGCFLGKK